MRYEGAVYRPPSEARSLIIQIALGCSHNKCTFCSMYKGKKFRIRKMEDILKDLNEARRTYGRVKRIFLADGNALVLKTENLKTILKEIKKLFPECERVGIYSAPKDILNKSIEELKELRDLGLGIAYLGVESGSDKVLQEIKKGVTKKEMIEAGKKMVDSGIKLSVMIISGLGGRDKFREHAIESADVINKINPDYLSLLTLLIDKNTEIYEKVNRGELELLKPKEIIEETKIFIENIDVTECTFRSNHPSNYVALAGVLPNDKNQLLDQLDLALNRDYGYKEEAYRRL